MAVGGKKTTKYSESLDQKIKHPAVDDLRDKLGSKMKSVRGGEKERER